MKPSGVDWIMEIPKEWDIAPLRFHSCMFKGLSIQKTDLVEEGVHVISYGQIHSKTNTGTHTQDELLRCIPRSLVSSGSSSLLKRGDLVFADTSEDVDGVGNEAYIDRDDEIYAGYHTLVCRAEEEFIDGKYFAYLTKTDCWREQLRQYAMGVKVYSVTQSILGRVSLIVPPLDEQYRICELLDSLTERIDDGIESLTRQITVLERHKVSLIHEIVTKGLDKTVAMKPSGIEWIGDIPEHWDAKRLKYVAETSSGTTPDSGNLDYYDGAISWIQSGDLYKKDLVVNTQKTVTEKAIYECSVLNVYKAPFVVMAMYGASIGNVSYSLIDACVNQACCCIFPRGTGCSKYLFYVFRDAQNDLKHKALGGTQPNISQVIIKNEVIPVPPATEQQEIADNLDEKCTHIDAILETKRKQLEVLKKRRASLIYEYVTGKRRVS